MNFSTKENLFRPLLIVVLFSVFIALLYVAPIQNNDIKLAVITKQGMSGIPVYLTIPAINVQANIQQTGVTFNGEMEVPSDTADVGWYKLGTRPGEIGSAVISGHSNGENGENGVFVNLNKLISGDKVIVQDTLGKSLTFIVTGSDTFDPGYAEEIFSNNDGRHLNLITCDGVWSEHDQEYSKRLVIFSDVEGSF